MKKFVLSCFALCASVAFAGGAGPKLVPDYNRDGKIDEIDDGRLAAGEAFTVWLNDDDDAEGTDDGAEAGDTNNDLHDVPGGDGNDKDFADDHVNGRCDLLDFFPVLINVEVVPGWGDYTWKLSSKSVNVVFTQLQAGNAGDFHTKEEKALNDETPLYRAEVTKLAGDDGEDAGLPDGFLNEGRGVILIEGAALAEGGLTLRGTKAGSDPVEVTLDLRVVDVEKMYGWLNLRPKGDEAKNEDEGEQWKVENSSVRLSPSPSPNDSRHFILVHGYNTNHEEARGNAAEFYKKLWQSGSDAMMTAVEWKGDQSQIKFEELGVNFSPNYHVNVENAFAAARPFAEACKNLPGEKILVGHSLGNMLISSAIKDYGLDYTKYVMLNAAVPREAYDASAYDEDMVDEDWLDDKAKVQDEGEGEDQGEGEGEGEGMEGVTNHLDRAARWYRNFADRKYDPYEYRRKLAWRGRFANLPRTVNYYSRTDNVLLNPDPHEKDPDGYSGEEVWGEYLNRLVGTKNQKTGFGFWSFSEKMKGTWVIDVINDVLTNTLGMAQTDAYKCEAGWGENDEYDDDPDKPFDPANTRFTPFLDARMKTRGMLDILPAETERLRAQHLADAIPAESFAAGANEVATLENVNMESFIGENPDWPVVRDSGLGIGDSVKEWKHSTFREVAFYHTSKFYTSIAAIGKPRVIIDTDLGSSMDDLFTIDLAARMHHAGKLDLMAVMMNRPDKSDPEEKGEFLKFADRYLGSLGLGDLPIGTSTPLEKDRLPQRVFNPYWTFIHSNNLTGVGLMLPTNRTDTQIGALTNAVTLYRRLLDGAPDKSVVICSLGFLNNLKALMDSEANYKGDDIGSTGLELIAAKVKELRIMAGCFDSSTAPGDTNGAEYNAAGDPAGTKKVFEQWPTPVVVSTWEVGLKLWYDPKNVLADFPPGTFNPVVRAAYTYWPNPPDGFMNRLWDPMTVLPLAEGETLAPLSEMGGISVDEKGKTTFMPDPSSNRCYQVASNMNAAAVMNRFRAICRTGNPSVSVVPISPAEPSIDYNGSVMSVELDGVGLGRYSIEDLCASLTVEGEVYEPDPDSINFDELGGVLTFTITVPPDKVTAGNEYDGEVTVSLVNDALGENVLYRRTRKLVQGRQEQAEPMTDWFNETDLEAPTNYVPATEMPERCLATVETTFLFEAPVEATDEPPATNAVQGAVRIVADGADGYKFQYYACVGKTNEDSFVRGWWDFNAGGEDVSEIKPVLDKEYTVRAEAYYFEDARGEENTFVIWVGEVGSNQGMLKQFVGNIINARGGQGGTTRLNSVEFLGDGEISSLVGNYYTNTVNATLAKIDGDREYATVAEAVAAAKGNPIRLLHAASWKPTAADLDKSVRFLNKNWLNLDLSGLPANALPVWTDVDGNNGTLTLELIFADTVVYGTIRTAEEGNPVAEALAIADGKYVYVGDKDGVAAFIEDGVTEVIDHRGKGMVMPGCTDGHSHYTMKFGLDNMKGGVVFALEDDTAKVLQKVDAAAQAAKDAGKKSLFGFGWNIIALRITRKPTLAELDAVTHGVSTVIFDQAGHSAFCNSECLKRCKILSEDGKTVLIKKIDGGLLELDDNDYPTGYVDERVTGYLTRMGGIDADEIVDDEVAEATMRVSQELLLSTGYTIAMEGWSNMLHPRKLYEAAHRMDTNGVLKLVFPMTYEVEPWQTNMTEQIEYLDSLNKKYRTDHVRPEYLKIFMDGVVETKTGATIKPYKPDESHPEGVYYKSFWTTNRLADITKACNAKGLTVHTHTMGDAAIRDVTDAYIYGGDGTHRNCLVHLRNVRPEDFQRFADNNIACTAGFTWHVANGEEVDKQFAEFLEDEYIKHAYPMKSFFDAGVKVSSHSDFPANIPCPQDPFGIMQVAVTGLPPNPPDGLEPYDTNELVTVEQVFQALTLNGAWQVGLENERGSIKVGKYADFVLADQDVFACAATNIHKTKVVSTWFEGEKVYQAGTEDTPWQIGAATTDAVTAWTNGTGRLVIDGRGAMKDFVKAGPWGTAVTDVDFGAQVTNIGANAFAGCSALKTLTMRGYPPVLGAGNDLAQKTIVVREDVQAKFKAADGWKGLSYGMPLPVCYDYKNIKKHVPYLREVWYGDYVESSLDGDDAPFGDLPVEGLGGCSSVRVGNFHGRNLDIAVSDLASMVIHMAATSNRFASVGTTQWFDVSETALTNDAVSVFRFDVLPNWMLDGINEKGVAINVNIIPMDVPQDGDNPASDERPALHARKVARYVLDHAESAAGVIEQLKGFRVFGNIGAVENNIHWMISDAEKTFVAEVIKGEVVAREHPIMTNFNINWDNENQCAIADPKNWGPEKYFWAAAHSNDTDTIFKTYTRHAEGIERYIRLRDSKEGYLKRGATFEGMVDLMRETQYSKIAYLPLAETYLSDLLDMKEVKDAGFESLADIYAASNATKLAEMWKELRPKMTNVYENLAQHRNPDKMVPYSITTHNVTFDLARKMFRIAVQEDYEHTFDFYLTESEPLAPGQSSEPFDSEELARAAIESGAVSFAPAPDVEKVLLDSIILTIDGYKAMFAPVIYPSADKYRVMYALTENATNALEQSVRAVVTNLNLAALAAAPEEGVDLSLKGGVPGFYYTLFKSAAVTNVLTVGAHDKKNSDKLCDKMGTVTFQKVTKPSDAAGFFTVGASPEQVFTGEADLAGAVVVISPILVIRVE